MLETIVPDLVVTAGPRSILSLIGIILLIAGVRYVDRTRDEKGSAAYKRAKVSSTDENVIIPDDELDKAFAFPSLFIIGWIIFAASYIFPADGGWAIQVSGYTLGAMIFSLALAAIASVPMGDAVRYRKKDKKMKLGMMFVLSWVGLTITSGLANDLGTIAYILGGVGMVSIIASMKLLRKYRKMGDSWEQNGKPNPNPIVYNMGGPLFVFGWFLFWIGMASTLGSTGETGLPIYFNIRTLIAFLAGCGMVPIVMMVDYAHDEGGKYVGYGTDGSFFGRFFESPIPFIAMRILFGFASFLLVSHNRALWILINCLIIGLTAGIFIQTALYEGNLANKTKGGMIFMLLFIALALNIGWGYGISLYLALAGALLVVAGQKTVFGDRKRGDYWMETKKVNPNPIVYSAGELFFITGWILLSLAVSTAI